MVHRLNACRTKGIITDDTERWNTSTSVVTFKEGMMFNRAFWRRTLGHAGVYYSLAGLNISVISVMALAIDHYYSAETIFGLLELLGGMLMLAAGLYMLYGSLMWFDGASGRRSFKSALSAFFTKVRAIPRGEMALVTVPYWLSRAVLLLALLYASVLNPNDALFVFILISIYCLVRWIIFDFILSKRYRNLVILPFDLILAIFIVLRFVTTI
jgi:hypothetical protein